MKRTILNTLLVMLVLLPVVVFAELPSSLRSLGIVERKSLENGDTLIYDSGRQNFVSDRQRGVITYAIADPGDAGAIPVTYGGYCPIVTGSAHTRTLAIPTFVGQEILLFVKTDGGTVVITTASAINQAGNNTLTMADVNDSIRLHAVDNNGTLCWRVVCNDGAALSTVP